METHDCKVRILSLNLFLRPPFVKTNHSDYKDYRTKYFCEHIMQHFDVICLQEVFGAFNNRKQRIISEAYKKGFLHHAKSPSPSFFGGIPVIDGGLVILSRFKILESKFIPFSHGTMPDALSYKGALYSKLLVHGEVIHLVTTHTQASYLCGDSSIYRSIRAHQLSTIQKFIKELGNNQMVLLMGDLNVEQECHGLFEEARDILKEKYNYSPATYGRVLNGKPLETVLTCPDSTTSQSALDYILSFNSSSKFKFDLDLTRVEPFYVRDRPFTQISDHAGVVTTLKLKT